MDETTSTSNPTDEKMPEKSSTSKSSNEKRLRKIKHQMDFYFSDSNLQRDRLLYKMIKDDQDGSVDLPIFLTFNRIRDLKVNITDLKQAIRYSSNLELIQNETRVHRKVPFVPLDEKDIDERTVYVERLPTHFDDNVVRNIFKEFGPIRYVCLPRFRNTRKVKGFAFVEFQNTESVAKACEFYKALEQEEKQNQNKSEDKKLGGKKRRISESRSPQKNRRRRRSENEKSLEKESRKSDSSSKTGVGRVHHKQDKHRGKKRKRSSSESEKKLKRVRKSSKSLDEKEQGTKKEFDCSSSADEGNLSSISQQKDISSMDESSDVNEDKDTKTVEGSASIDDKVSLTDIVDVKREVENKPEMTSLNQPMVSKTDELGNCATLTSSSQSNREENEQSDSKSALVGIKQESCASNEDIETKRQTDEDVGSSGEQKKKRNRKKKKKSNSKLKFRVMSKNDWKVFRNKYLNLQRRAMSRIKKVLMLERQQKNECNAMLSSTNEVQEHLPQKESVESVFQPNVILKVALIEPPTSAKTLITDVKALGDVAFVDVSDPKEIFVRYRNPEAAAKCVEEKKLDRLGSCEMISGQEEKAYWEKIERNREEQYNREKSKKRGRDKILNRAEKLKKATHVHFEDV